MPYVTAALSAAPASAYMPPARGSNTMTIAVFNSVTGKTTRAAARYTQPTMSAVWGPLRRSFGEGDEGIRVQPFIERRPAPRRCQQHEQHAHGRYSDHGDRDAALAAFRFAASGRAAFMRLVGHTLSTRATRGGSAAYTLSVRSVADLRLS